MTMLAPMAAMVFYIFVLGVVNLGVRRNAVRTQSLSLKYFRTYDAREFTPPEFVVRMGRHYDNQFELPLLFLITVLVSIICGIHGRLPVALSWAFVFSRMLHSYFHLSSNHILKRMGSFFLGWIIILALWIVILLQI